MPLANGRVAYATDLLVTVAPVPAVSGILNSTALLADEYHITSPV